MKQSDKEALQVALKVIGLSAAFILALAIIALIVWAVMQVHPIAAIIILIIAILLLSGVIIFFLER